VRASIARLGSVVALMAPLASALGCDARLYPITGAPPIDVTCPTDMVGFATEGGGTTGGGSATPITVSTADAFRAAAEAEAPAVIQVNGTFVLDEGVRVASNKTLIGLGDSSGFTGAGLALRDSENVIIRNLVIARAVDADAITVQHARRVWIDHCDLSSDRDHEQGTYDGLVDITHASDYVTVSWTVFHDHFDSGLVGHSSDNAAEDTGHLTVTYHHNLFARIEGGPRIRFGTVHVYDNYFADVTLYAVASQMGATVLVERNWFDQVATPILTRYNDPVDGTAHQIDNVYRDSGASTVTADTTWRPLYSYLPESADTARPLIGACAGAGARKLGL
jgi:pectate lyase